MPRAISQLVAALVKQATAAPVEHQFTISQVDGLWLCAGQAGKQPHKPSLGYWEGVDLAHQAKSPSVAAKWVKRGCRFKRRSQKVENPNNIAATRVSNGGLGRNRTIDTRIFKRLLDSTSLSKSTACATHQRFSVKAVGRSPSVSAQSVRSVLAMSFLTTQRRAGDGGLESIFAMSVVTVVVRFFLPIFRLETSGFDAVERICWQRRWLLRSVRLC